MVFVERRKHSACKLTSEPSRHLKDFDEHTGLRRAQTAEPLILPGPGIRYVALPNRPLVVRAFVHE
jgi:hypothetical protein